MDLQGRGKVQNDSEISFLGTWENMSNIFRNRSLHVWLIWGVEERMMIFILVKMPRKLKYKSSTQG